MSRLGEKPDSIRGKRWAAEEKAKPYGKVLHALFLHFSRLRANRKNAVWHTATEGE